MKGYVLVSLVIICLTVQTKQFDIWEFLKELQEQMISDNPDFRKISDDFDRLMGWEGDKKEKSPLRGAIHGVYHASIGIMKGFTGNVVGAEAEFKRAVVQFSKIKPLTDVVYLE